MGSLTEAEASERFLRQFARSRKRLDRIADGEVRSAMRFVGELRDEIRGILRFNAERRARGAPPTFAVRSLPRIATDIERALEQWAQATGQSLKNGFEGAFELGATITTSGLKAGGVEDLVFPSVSPELLRTASNNLDGVLDEVGRQFAQRITRQINIAAVGLQPVSQAQRRIEQMLRTEAQEVAGARRRIGFPYQAEAIARTETGRVFTTTQHAASLELSSQIKNLRKRWLTIGGAKVRTGHREAEKVYDVGGSKGPIRVRERFVVNDFSRVEDNPDRIFTRRVGGRQRTYRIKGTGPHRRRGRKITDRMLHPLDPRGSPGNVISCRCVVLEIIPELDQAISRSAGILKEALG